MERQKLILIGGGGHCKSCIDVIEETQKYEILGVLDRSDLVGSNVLDYKIIGTDDEIIKYVNLGCQFLVTIGQIKTPKIRNHIVHLLREANAPLATIMSVSAKVSKYAKIGEGTIVMHHVIVNAAAVVGENCILNSGCDIEHDVVIGNNSHISTYAVVNGDCMIGDDVFVGSNATISNQVNVGNRIVIGSGSVVIKSINQEGTYVGNPLKKIN